MSTYNSFCITGAAVCNTVSTYSGGSVSGFFGTGASDSSILGVPQTNSNYGNYSSITGGSSNNITTSSNYAFLGGGGNNNIQNETEYNTLGGGCLNNINQSSFNGILGGFKNAINNNSNGSAIAGGYTNLIGSTGGNQEMSFIGSGCNNCIINGPMGAILGGCGNTVSHAYAGVFGKGVSSSAVNTFHVNCLNACDTPSTYSASLPKGAIFYDSGTPPTACALPLYIRL